MNSKTRPVAVVGGNRIPFARSNSVYSHASRDALAPRPEATTGKTSR